MIPVTKPYIPNQKKYFANIKRVNDSAWLTNFGPLHQELTAKLEDYLGVKNLLLVSNGTLALQVAYQTFNMKGAVLTTPFSFIASSSTLVWERLQPQYIDISRKNLALDTDLLPKMPAKNTAGILAVHVYGNPADTTKLDSYGAKNNLKVIYDGAHAFGIKRKGKSILTAGDATTLSLHATKVFHTVEGGAIIFKRKEDFNIAKEIINFGLNNAKDIVRLGTNSKLSEYHAAAGLAVFDDLDYILQKRAELFDRYNENLKNDFRIPDWDKHTSKNGAYAPIIFDSEKQLLKSMTFLSEKGIQTRRYFYPSLNEIKAISKNAAKCPVSEDVARKVLCIPMYTELSKAEQNKVITTLKKSMV